MSSLKAQHIPHNPSVCSHSFVIPFSAQSFGTTLCWSYTSHIHFSIPVLSFCLVSVLPITWVHLATSKHILVPQASRKVLNVMLFLFLLILAASPRMLGGWGVFKKLLPSSLWMGLRPKTFKSPLLLRSDLPYDKCGTYIHSLSESGCRLSETPKAPGN
jgi:hypothetical protein